jgi:hypothetical protein
VRKTQTRSLILYSVLGLFLISGCTTDPEPAPKESGDPELVHSESSLVLHPGEVKTEKLYVRNPGNDTWSLILIDTPAWANQSNGIIVYNIPEGMTGFHEIHAIASNGNGILLRADWTVETFPNANLPPTIVFDPVPDWLLVNRTFRVGIRITDPEGLPLVVDDRVRPVGSVYHNGILEWTPKQDQIGIHNLIFAATDVKSARTEKPMKLAVMSYDPRLYGAELTVGKTWWIRGYSVHPTMDIRDTIHVDSTWLKRRLTITSHDAQTGTFAFRTIDTLSRRGIDSVSESEFTAESKEGFQFAPKRITGSGQELADAMPFWLPGEAVFFDTTSFDFQGKSYPSRHLIYPLKQEKYSSTKSEALYSQDLGMAWRKTELISRMGPGTGIYKTDFEVWAVADP